MFQMKKLREFLATLDNISKKSYNLRWYDYLFLNNNFTKIFHETDLYSKC